MKNGDVLADLRQWRDEFARSHGYDIHAMAAALRDLDRATQRTVVRGEPRRPATDQRRLPTAAVPSTQGM